MSATGWATPSGAGSSCFSTTPPTWTWGCARARSNSSDGRPIALAASALLLVQMGTGMTLANVVAKVAGGGRVDADEALLLYRQAPTQTLGRLADGIRRRKHPSRVVTYIIDRNVNYTNICVARCNFCAFYREVGSKDGYVLGFEEIFRKIDETIAVGGNQLLLQGGHNPDLPAGVVRGPVPRHQGEVPGLQAARAVAARSAAHLAAGIAADGGRDRPAGRGGPRQHSRRRRRDAGGPRPQDPELLLEGVVGRMAVDHARGAPGGPAHHGHDDVRHRRDRGRADRAHDAAARPAGRDRRLHGLHHLELPARAHRARRLRADRRGLPADAGARAHRPRQLRQPAGLVGHPGRQGGAAEPGVRRQRHGQRDDRGKRRPGCGRRLLHGRGRDRGERRGRRLRADAAQHALRAAGRAGVPRTRTCRACCRWPPRGSTATPRCPRS